MRDANTPHESAVALEALTIVERCASSLAPTQLADKKTRSALYKEARELIDKSSLPHDARLATFNTVLIVSDVCLASQEVAAEKTEREKENVKAAVVKWGVAFACLAFAVVALIMSAQQAATVAFICFAFLASQDIESWLREYARAKQKGTSERGKQVE